MTKRLLLGLGVVAAALAATARGEMVVEWWGEKYYCRHQQMKIELSKYGKEGMINPEMGKKPVEGIHALTFDLSNIQRGTRIYHASLRLHAPEKRIRTDKRAYMSIGSGHWYHDPLRLYAEIPPWKPIEIYVARKGSREGKASYDEASRVKPEPPQYKSFDVTQAVRDWVGGKQPNLGFVVRQLDLWDWAPGRTVLEVRYEGKVKDPPPQAGDVKAFHRGGQTFITWTETEKIIDAEQIYWNEFEATFKKHGPRKGKLYRVYRADEPITAGNLHQAELIDEIWPLSGYDFRMHEHVTRGEDWMGLNPKALVPRYCIQAPPAGPLPPNGKHGSMNQWYGKQLPLHTGLYVHQARKAGRGYYAVTACVDGVENTRDVTSANATAEPVTEAVAPGQPLLYRWLDQSLGRGRGRAIRETQFFLYWAAPPYANQPRRPIHIMVGLQGAKPGANVKIRYNVGDMYGSEINAGTHLYEWRGAERIFSIIDDAAFGDKVYWSSWNTLLSGEQATRQNYTEKMVEMFTPWAKKLTTRVPAAPE